MGGDPHPCLASGYNILVSKAASHNRGGIAILWKDNGGEYEVEFACVVMPNLLNKQFYCMGVYIPPTDKMGVEDIWVAWEACTEGCIPLVLGDLNVNFRDPRNKREELIVNLLNNINIVVTLRRLVS